MKSTTRELRFVLSSVNFVANTNIFFFLVMWHGRRMMKADVDNFEWLLWFEDVKILFVSDTSYLDKNVLKNIYIDVDC